MAKMGVVNLGKKQGDFFKGFLRSVFPGRNVFSGECPIFSLFFFLPWFPPF